MDGPTFGIWGICLFVVVGIECRHFPEPERCKQRKLILLREGSICKAEPKRVDRLGGVGDTIAQDERGRDLAEKSALKRVVPNAPSIQRPPILRGVVSASSYGFQSRANYLNYFTIINDLFDRYYCHPCSKYSPVSTALWFSLCLPSSSHGFLSPAFLPSQRREIKCQDIKLATSMVLWKDQEHFFKKKFFKKIIIKQ